MASWARYTGAIYFGLMMSGAMAPPDWGLASAPAANHAALSHAKPATHKHNGAAEGKTPTGLTATPAAADRPPGQPPAWARDLAPDAPRPRPRAADPPTPGPPDLLR